MGRNAIFVCILLLAVGIAVWLTGFQDDSDRRSGSAAPFEPSSRTLTSRGSLEALERDAGVAAGEAPPMGNTTSGNGGAAGFREDALRQEMDRAPTETSKLFGTIRAHVLSPSGEPVPDAEVHFLEARWERRVLDALAAETRWDLQHASHSDGAVVVVHEVVPGRYKIFAGSRRWSASEPQEILVPEGGVVTVRFELASPGRLRIQVVSAEGVPQVEQRLRIEPMRDLRADRDEKVGLEHVKSTGIARNCDFSDSLLTDSMGVAAVDALPAGTYRVSTKLVGVGAETLVEVAAGELTEATLTGLGRTMIKGRAIDSAGQGLAGVTVYSAFRPDLRRDLKVTTDGEGRFSLDVLEGQRRSLIAEKTGYATTNRGVPKSGAEVVLTLYRTAGIEGRVTGADGQPISAKVRIGDTFSDTRTHTEPSDGSYRITDLAPGETVVEVEADGYEPGSSWVQLEEGELKGGVDFRLLSKEEAAAAGGIVEGRILLPDGSVAEMDVFVEIREVDGPPFGIPVLAEGGHYLAGPLTPGTYEVWAKSRGSWPPSRKATLVLKAGERQTQDLQLGAAVRILGEVVDENGRGLEGLRVSGFLEDPPSTLREAVSGTKGEFLLTNATAGTLSLFVSEQEIDSRLERTLHRERVSVPEGAEEWSVRLTLHSKDRVSFLGRLLLDDVPLAGALVILEDSQDSGLSKAWGRTDEQGAFDLSYVEPGPAVLVVLNTEQQKLLAQIEVTVPDRAEARRDFRLTSTRVFGRVDPAGESAGTLAAWNRNELTGPRWAIRTDQNGSFELQGIPAGEYALIFVEPRCGSIDRIDVGSGDVNVGRVSLAPSGIVQLEVRRKSRRRERIKVHLLGGSIWSQLTSDGFPIDYPIGLPVGRYDFRIDIEGRDPMFMRDVIVEAGETTQRTIEIE